MVGQEQQALPNMEYSTVTGQAHYKHLLREQAGMYYKVTGQEQYHPGSHNQELLQEVLHLTTLPLEQIRKPQWLSDQEQVLPIPVEQQHQALLTPINYSAEHGLFPGQSGRQLRIAPHLVLFLHQEVLVRMGD